MRCHCRSAITVFAVLLLVPLAGCGGKPMAFPVPESEMPPAPGLFTGESGQWDIPVVRDKPRPPS